MTLLLILVILSTIGFLLLKLNGSYNEKVQDNQENRTTIAKNYLLTSSFSRIGLINQLIYEGFSEEQATLAVDSCKVDWNNQAFKTAKSYINSTSFSKTSLISQLEYEGFTEEEARIAVENCKVDWNNQAFKTAKFYLSSMELTTDELIQQLEYEGFTYKQSMFGAKRAICVK